MFLVKLIYEDHNPINSAKLTWRDVKAREGIDGGQDEHVEARI